MEYEKFAINYRKYQSVEKYELNCAWNLDSNDSKGEKGVKLFVLFSVLDGRELRVYWLWVTERRSALRFEGKTLAKHVKIKQENESYM